MRNSKLSKFFILMVFLTGFNYSASAILNAGDIAIIGVNADVTPAELALVTLAPIASGEVIYISDYAWDGSIFTASTTNNLTAEGVVTWTTTSAIPAGTVIKVSITPGSPATVAISYGLATVASWSNLIIGQGGDSWLIYQGSSPLSPVKWIYGFANWSANITIPITVAPYNWVGSLPTTTTSCLPSTLTNGSTANALTGNSGGTPSVFNPHYDNLVYIGTKSGTKSALLTAIATPSNWQGDEIVIKDLNPGGANFFGSNPVFTVTPPNNSPTDITLSASAISENVAANSIVGTLSSTDPDAGNTFTYSLVSGTGSTDNASFNISSGNLQITNSPDFEAKSSFSVRVRTTDQGTLIFEKVFTITINDLVEVPIATTNSPATNIKSTGATLSGTINANSLSTAVTFEYGTSTNYGSTATASPSSVSGTSSTDVSVTLTGLQANTTYHFRVNGVNTAGTTNGADLTFTTSAAPTTISVVSTAGGLSAAITAAGGDLSTVTNLTITGIINDLDFKAMRDNMPILATLDLSGATIAAYTGTNGTGATSTSSYPANEVPQYAFYNYINSQAKVSLTSIKFPDSATSIGGWAMFRCSGLNGILTIPDLVTEIKLWAFSECTNMIGLVLGNKVTTIGEGAFSEGRKLNNLIFQNSVTTIGSGAFTNCTALTSLTIGSSVTTIDHLAFCCPNITTLVFGASLTSEWDIFCDSHLTSLSITATLNSEAGSALADCTVDLITLDDNNPNYSLVDGVLFNKDKTKLIKCTTSKAGNYVIPSTVTSLNDNAFTGCVNLTSLTITKSLIDFGDQNFESNLHTIYDYSTTPIKIVGMGVGMGGGSGFSGELHVPVGYKAAYQAVNDMLDPNFIFDDLALEPTVTGITPTNGPTAGGTSVEITGTNLTAASAVKFGATDAADFTVNSATQITAVSPEGSGAVDITVTTAGGTSATSSADQFTYVPAPTISGISPMSGSASGGTPVTITGANFTGATSVNIGYFEATEVSVVNATTITAITPAGSVGANDVVVTTTGGSGTRTYSFTFVATPTITGISPSSGPTSGGKSVIITGTNLTAATSVKFGTTAATGFTVNSATQITATSPAGSVGAVDITVTTAGGTSAISANDQFTYVVAPVITSFTPKVGTIGTTVTITGTGFSATPANNTVWFGAVKATVSESTTSSITVTVPAGAGSVVPVSVQVNGLIAYSATSRTPLFNVTNTPTLNPYYTVSNLEMLGNPTNIAVGDLNGDGIADMVSANVTGNNVGILIGTGTGSFNPAIYKAAGTAPYWVSIGDLNGDGKLDIVTANESASSNVNVLFGDGTGAFAASVSYTVTQPHTVYIADLNGDGISDLVTSSYNNSKINFLMGTGGGNFTVAPYAITSPPYSIDGFQCVAVSDYNGDGKADLAVSGARKNTISIFPGKGDGTFLTKTELATGGTWNRSIASADFNGDGKADLAVSNQSSGNVSVLLGDGVGGFSAYKTFVVGIGFEPNYMNIGDFNGDGKVDIATSNWRSYNISLLLGDGTGSFAAATNFSVGSTPTDVAVGDFNGDGKTDIAVPNYDGNTVSILTYSPAPIEVTTASGTPGLTGYSTLGSAFAAINLGTHKGEITVKVNASTIETAAAVLNASGGSSSYTSVNIYPTTTGLSISGNVDWSPLIDLNGADNVTIDGRVNATGSTVSLVISNARTSPNSNTSTIRFNNDATYNIIKYCKLQGSTTTGDQGIISFKNVATTTGNSNNTIDHNEITNAGGNRPRNALFSCGKSETVPNSSNIVTNNNIYNVLNLSQNYTKAIALYTSNDADPNNSYNTGWTISGNSFYDTQDISASGLNGDAKVIFVWAAQGSGFTISNNYIGGSAALCGGTWTKANGNNNFTLIWLNAMQTGAKNYIEGNTIKNFNLTNSGVTNCYGIYFNSGDNNVSNNCIGATTGTGSIIFTNGLTGGLFVGYNQGVYCSSTFNNNTIGSITVANSNQAYATNFLGIWVNSYCGSATTSNNLVGSTTTPNSINATSASTSNAQTMAGIRTQGGSTLNISNNTVANLTNGTTNTTTTTQGYIYGISPFQGVNTITGNTVHDLTIANANNGTGPVTISGVPTTSLSAGGIVAPINNGNNQTISGNTIYNISNSYSSFTGHVAGIYHYGQSSASSVTGNLIYGLSVSSSSSSANIHGIKIGGGGTTYSNNIITLGGNTTTNLYGIYELGLSGATSNIYFNTVYISGSPSSGTLNSACLYNAVISSTRNFRNNIFVNARSNSAPASGSHYALYAAATLGSLTCDYNDYYAPGTGGILGYYGGNKTVLPIVSGVTGNDDYSFNADPLFTKTGDTPAAYYLPTQPHLAGATLTGITTDFDGGARSTVSPAMGAIEYAVTPLQKVIVSTTTTGPTVYNTLKTAFDAINTGVHQGAITIAINASTTEVSAATLYQSGYNSTSNYTSVNIYPTVTGLSINGTIMLNGADNVTINGSVNALNDGNDLAIITSSSIATITFINGASNNTVKYCNVSGGSSSQTSGIILFSTASTSGNNSNVIDHNNITSYDNLNRPYNAIYSYNTLSSMENKWNTISNNNIYNTLHLSGTDTYVIAVFGYSSFWTIKGNSIYETSPQNSTGSASNVGIFVRGDGHTIENNYIGGNGPLCSGTFTYNVPSGSFFGVSIDAGSGATASVQNNTIKNFNLTCINWNGIYINSGNVNVGTVVGNTIGSGTGNGSVTLNYTTGNAIGFGIRNIGTGTVVIQNNSIGSVTTVGTDTGTSSYDFYGIHKSASAGTTTITNNSIGSTSTTNSIYASSASTGNAQLVYGIKSEGTGTTTISGNTISKLTNGTSNSNIGTRGLTSGIYIGGGTNTVMNNTVRDLTVANGNNSAYSDASVSGIALTNYTEAVQTISGNTIYNLSNNNTNTTFAGSVTGLYYAGGRMASTVSGNYVYGLSVPAESTAGNIYGIKIFTGVTTYSNNIISLGGNTLTNLYGIYETSDNNNMYFNTVSIGGIQASGSQKSYALYSASASGTRNFRNNIFSNTRSTTGGSNLNYAAFFNTSGLGVLTCDYNDYYAPGEGGILGDYNGNKTVMPIVSWAIGNDVHSINTNPLFANAGGTPEAYYLPASRTLIGVAIAGVTTDYDGATRSTSMPAMGAIEYGVYTITSPTATNIKLTTATLGATIAPTDAQLIDRGICWSTTAGVTIANNKTSAGGTTGGPFTVDVTGLTQSKTIYYRTYLTNARGTILSDNESSFTNVPVFTGTGTWDDATKWNVQEVPDNSNCYPVIDGNCTIAISPSDGLSFDSLTINKGAKLTINPAQVLLVGKITNNAGENGLVIKADPVLPNATFAFIVGIPSATVEMYSKASWDLTKPSGSRYNWQYFGIPIKTVAYNDAFSNSIVRKYNETATNNAGLWEMQYAGSTLTSGTGYEIVQAAGTTYSFKGLLTNADFSRTLPYTLGANYPGQHIFSNPYTAAIDITKIEFGANTENSVYLYNTGTYNNWQAQSTNDGNAPGQYTSSSKELAGTDGIPAQIPSMQGFLMRLTTNAAGSFSLKYWDGALAINNEMQRAPRKIGTSEKVITRIDVTSAHSADRMWIFTEPTCTREFDNGWDGYKMMGSALNPQLFAMERDGNYQIDVVPNIDETYLGFQAGVDTEFTLKFTQQNVASAYSKVYLMDLVEGDITDITADGSEYSFSAESTPTPVKRFKIVTSTSSITDKKGIADGQLKVFNSHERVYIENFRAQKGIFTLYDMKGIAVKAKAFEANKVTYISTQGLTPGVYLAKAGNGIDQVTTKIIIR